MYYYNQNPPVIVRMFMLLLCFSLTVTLQFQSNAVVLPDPSCPNKCGEVDIEFPFGVGAGCALAVEFELDCNKTENGSSNVTFYGNVPVLNISLQGQIQMNNSISSMCYNRSSGNITYNDWILQFSKLKFAEELNIFTVIGVNTLAYMIGSIVSYHVLIIFGLVSIILILYYDG